MEKISTDCYPNLRLEYMVEDYHELMKDNEADQSELEWDFDSEENQGSRCYAVSIAC